ncbi:hypothetical protein J1TS1_27690 [Shouchella clausii]|nr:hypothetical protein J1TS1_27690 [Shouchella clausii]
MYYLKKLGFRSLDQEDESIIQEAINLLSVPVYADQNMNTLSSGYQQHV